MGYGECYFVCYNKYVVMYVLFGYVKMFCVIL